MLQGSQLACIANNSISCNSRAGVLVEAECQVELRGSGIYENGSHGITSNGEGVITENDIIDDHRCGLQLLQAAHMKVRLAEGTPTRVSPWPGAEGTLSLLLLPTLRGWGKPLGWQQDRRDCPGIASRRADSQDHVLQPEIRGAVIFRLP